MLWSLKSAGSCGHFKSHTKRDATLPSGKQVDAVNPEAAHVKELKPDNPRAIRRSEKQVEEYRQELQKLYPNKCWTCSVETYKP